MKWQEPPMPGHSTAAQIEAEVRELKANPGKWALVREGMSSTGATSPWKERGCEATSRKGADGRVDVWARWTGENEDVEPDPADLPDPHTMGGYMAARAARREQAEARKMRPEQGAQVKRWTPGGVAAAGVAPARAQSTRGTRRGR